MDNYYVVLIFIASIIYKVYENYKKEMDSAKKRQSTMRRQSTPPIPVESRSATPPAPRPTVIESKSPYNSAYQEYTSTALPEEVLKMRKAIESKKKSEAQIKRIQLESDDETETKSNIKFDLRQAIIQSVILERPYK